MNGKMTILPEVKLLRSMYYPDSRGAFCQAFSMADWRSRESDCCFVQDNWSVSRNPGTVRGLHFQAPPFAQAKLIQVLNGAIFDVVVDIRRSSATFGHHMAVQLVAGPDQLFVPAGFAHGFMSLVPDTVIFYKVSSAYEPSSEAGIRWNDPELEIDWPMVPPPGHISSRDMALPFLGELSTPFS
jgi:dTDP-4-dehydrorhamnose 3,5-epimerase